MDFFLPEELSWNAALGRDLCIIDLDDRPFNESGQVFGPDIMTWYNPGSVHGLSLGILNHFLYSRCEVSGINEPEIADNGSRQNARIQVLLYCR